ncbi:MAG: heparinase II/III family protein [Armatimonadetes bacterium]|nr:heparinase II/III family protein [Armatimonadota bacterium]
MRGSLIVLWMGTICTGAGGLGQGAEPARGANLVPNGGFEADADGDGMPDGWTLAPAEGDARLKGALSTQGRAGRRSFCVEKGLGKRPASLTSPRFDLKPNAAYEASVRLRMDGPLPQDSVNLCVVTDDGSKYFELHVGRQWRQYTVSFTTEPGATSATVQLRQLGILADRLYIDDVAVREKPTKDAPPPLYQTDLTRFEFPEDRPRVERTAAEIAEMKQAMAGRDIREHDWVTRAEKCLPEPLHFFEEGCDQKYYSTGVLCPVDGAGLRAVLKPVGNQEMQCPKCGKVYKEEAHRAIARAHFNQLMASWAWSLGRGYALTGDERYARKAAEILLGFAGHYRQWGGGSHAVHYVLHEPYAFLTPCATAYDYIHDSQALSAVDRRKIEDDLLRVGAEFYSQNGIRDRLNNRSAIYSEAVMAIGVAIHDKGFVDHAINNPYAGFHALVSHIFDADGMSFEGFGCHAYTMTGLTPIAERAYRVGINVYKDPAYRKVFEAPLRVAPLDVLLPGWNTMVEDYKLASRRFTDLGQPMAYPFGEAKEAVPQASFNFRDFGYGVLRSGQRESQTSVSMEYGKETMFMGHAPAPKFAMLLYANGRMTTPRGAATYEHEYCGAWSRRSLAHNTVTVDERDQWGRTPGRFVAFETAPRVQVMRAADDQSYGGIMLDRTLFLADGYVVDLSAALAESGRHRYDFCYRNFGKLSCALPFMDRKGPLGSGNGYQYLTDVRSARTADTWQADWRQAEESALRLWVAGGPATEVIACTSPSNQDPDENVDAVVVRRWGEGTVFASVWEPYRDKALVSRVRRLQVRGAAGKTGDSQGVGIEVAREGQPGADCFLASHAPGKKSFGDIELDGKIAAGRWRGGQAAPDYLQLVQGVLLKRGAHSIAANAPATLYVEQISPDRLLVKLGSNSAGKLTLVGHLPGAAKVTCDGKPVAAKVAREQTLTFEVARNASYEVAGVDGWQSIRLAGVARVEPEEAPQAEAVPAGAATPPAPGVQAALAPDGSLAGRNKVANGSFEVSDKTHPGIGSPWEFWSSYYIAKFRADCQYDGEVAHSGKHSLRIVNTNWYGAVSQDAWAVQKVPGAWANKTVTLSLWVKASDAPTRVRLCLYGFNPEWGNDYEGGVSPRYDLGTEWQRLTWTRTFGPDVTEVYVMVKREHQVRGGDIWVDDVQLEEGGQATEFAPDAWTAAAVK